MGLFDRFKRRVKEVADEVDTDSLTVNESSIEGQELAAAKQQTDDYLINNQSDGESSDDNNVETDEDDWEIFEDGPTSDISDDIVDDDDWEDLDEDDDILPQPLTRKERKRLQKEQKQREKVQRAYEKSMKKRGATEVARPAGSKVDLSMMRTTTGRKLVQVAQAPKGSTKSASIETETGSTIEVDLGGGVVEQGGRLIKASSALDNLLEELEWVLLESDISSDAVSAVIDLSLIHI